MCYLGGPVPFPSLSPPDDPFLSLEGAPWRSRPHPPKNLPHHGLMSLLSPSQHLFTQHLISFSHLQFLSGFDFIREGRSSCCPGKLFQAPLVQSLSWRLSAVLGLLAAAWGDEGFSYPVRSFSDSVLHASTPRGWVRQGWRRYRTILSSWVLHSWWGGSIEEKELSPQNFL